MEKNLLPRLRNSHLGCEVSAAVGLSSLTHRGAAESRQQDGWQETAKHSIMQSESLLAMELCEPSLSLFSLCLRSYPWNPLYSCSVEIAHGFRLEEMEYDWFPSPQGKLIPQEPTGQYRET